MRMNLINVRRRSLGVLGLILAASIGCAFAQGENGGGGRLAGTWDVHVTIRNCQTGAEIRNFDSITQFMTGGTLIDSTSAIPQALKTPGHGNWRHLRDNSYRFSFKAFHFDPAGIYTDYRILTHEADLDSSGDSYISAGTLQIFAPDGTLVQSGCSTTTATRMDLD